MTQVVQVDSSSISTHPPPPSCPRTHSFSAESPSNHPQRTVAPAPPPPQFPRRDALALLGITQVVEVASSVDGDGHVVYDAEELVLAIGQLLLGQQQPTTPAAGL
mgnify:CR=1 FL=1